jgi:hypothetical protein
LPRTVPVTGQAVPGAYETAAFWNAQVKTAVDFLLNPPLFSAYASALQSVPNNTATDLTLDTEEIDTDGGHSTTTNTARYTCQVPGVYLVTGGTTFAAVNTTGLRMVEIAVSGTTVPAGAESLVPPSSTQLLSISTTPVYVRLAVGDYVTLRALQTSGASLNVGFAGGGTQTKLTCRWVAP